jgi:hypothetical protein
MRYFIKYIGCVEILRVKYIFLLINKYKGKFDFSMVKTMVVLEEGGSATLKLCFFFFFFQYLIFNKKKKNIFFNVTWHQQTLQNWLKIQQNDHFHIHEKLMQLKLKK